MFRFEDLEIWKLSFEYADRCYNIASRFPQYEQYALSDQLRRATLSISNNIAEGSGSSTNNGFAAFLDISIKSALETVNILYFAKKRKYIDEKARVEMYGEAELLIKKIRAFKNSLNRQ